MEETEAMQVASSSSRPAALRPQYLTTLAGTLVVLSGGCAVGWTSAALPELSGGGADSLVVVTPEQGSWVGSLLAVGALVGALPAGAAADAVGRKKLMWVLGGPMTVSWVLTVVPGGVWALYSARLLAGLALGAACTVVPLYIAEIAQDSVRGMLCSYFQLMLVAGILYAYVAGAVATYRVYCLLCAVVPLVFLLVFFKCPESPSFLLRKGRKPEAARALAALRGPHYHVQHELNYLQGAVDKEGESEVSVAQMLRRRQSVRALLISLGLMFFQQMSGINVVIFYSSSIFRDVGAGLDPSLATILVGLAQVGATYVSGLLIDRAGRRLLLMVSAVVMAICLAVLGQFFHLKAGGTDVSHLGLVPLVAVIVYMLVFSVGFGPVPWLMSGEVFPPEIKALGTGLAVALNWSLAFTVTKSFQDMLEALGAANTYWLFAVLCCLAAGFVALVVIETKGKSLEQIQRELARTSS